VTENFGVRVVYTCFLSNKIPQKLWASEASPLTSLEELQSSPDFLACDDGACCLLPNKTAAVGPVGLVFGETTPLLF